MNKKANPYNSRTNQHKCYKDDKKKLDKLFKLVRKAYYSDIDKLTINFEESRKEETENIKSYSLCTSFNQEEYEQLIIENFKEEFGDVFTDEEILQSLEFVKETDLSEYTLWDLKVLLDRRKEDFEELKKGYCDEL